MEHELKRTLAPKYKLALIEHTADGTTFTCVECPASFYEKEQLELHLCTHFGDYRFLCSICGTGLKRKEHLDRHLLGHQEVRPHVCPQPDCGKAFKRKEHLNIHMSIHSGDKAHICALCHRSFYRKDHLQKHMQTHTKLFAEQNLEFVDIKQEDESMDSVECEVTMEVDEMNESTKPAIPKDPLRPFECPICHKTYKRRDHLKLHSVTHLKKEHSCAECGKAFHKEEQLLAHMALHVTSYHSVEEPAASPTVDVHSLFDHSEIDIVPLEEPSLLVPRTNYRSCSSAARDAEDRRFECPTCHRKFKRKQHLKVHANVHAKLPPTIWCSLCTEGFASNEQFENHNCAPPAPPAAAPADAEQTVDFGEYGLKIAPASPPAPDLNPATDESRLPAPQRVYVCKYCGKAFRRKDHYRIHTHIHTGLKSFFCPHCDKGFYRKDHLQKHVQVHFKSKPAASPARASNPRPKKALPDLFPISVMSKNSAVKPEITITAPANAKLRVPLQIKVPYQVVVSRPSAGQTVHA